jgi:hypothetical protein
MAKRQTVMSRINGNQPMAAARGVMAKAKSASWRGKTAAAAWRNGGEIMAAMANAAMRHGNGVMTWQSAAQWRGEKAGNQ